MAIPKKDYREEDGIMFVTKELIKKYHTPEEVEAFNKWFCGQTGMIASDGSYGVYTYDYERWIAQGKLTKQLSNYWD